jgi:hypothetical protein
MKTVRFGRLEIQKHLIEGKSFEEVVEIFPNYRENLLKGAWEKVNPKGKLKKPIKKDEE